MNRESNPLFAEPASQRPKQWLKITGYVLLLVVVAWLYSHPPVDEKPPEQAKPSKQAISISTESRDAARAANNGRTAQQTARQAAPRNDDQEPEAKNDGSPEPRKGRGQDVIVHNARVVDKDGRVIYRGDVDLTSTLDRIERGVRLRFLHDGIVFENREKRLPRQPAGYYHEFVHPTPDDNGPGGQRVVIGRDGEVYYTPDHYHTFRRIR